MGKWVSKNGLVFCFINYDSSCSNKRSSCSMPSFQWIFAFTIDPSNEEKGYSFSLACTLAVGCEVIHSTFYGFGLAIECGMTLVCI